MKKNALLLVSIVIILLSVGYSLYDNKEYSRKSDGTTTNSIPLMQEGQDVEKNTLRPMITKARLHVESADNVDRLKVIIEENPNAKRDVKYTYEWFKNGRSFGGNDDNVTGFKKGDKIDVRITPFDGTHYGQPVLLTFNIARVPPKIVENRAISFDGNVLSYQVKAVDPDGGKLTYSLVDAPEGMTIDRETGMIKWQPKTKEGGKYSVNVCIKNSGGAQAIYPLSLDIGKAVE